MRNMNLFSKLVLCAGLLAGGVAVTAYAQQSATAARPDVRQEMSIPQAHDKLTALGYGDIREIERERGVFEVKASDKNGGRVKLYVDARTGEIVNHRENHRGSRDYDRSDRERSGR